MLVVFVVPSYYATARRSHVARDETRLSLTSGKATIVPGNGQKREREKRKKTCVFAGDYSSRATPRYRLGIIRPASFCTAFRRNSGAQRTRVEDLFPLGQSGAAKETGENRRHNARRPGIRMFALTGVRTAFPSLATLSL